MFEDLTCFIPKFVDTKYGEWVIDRENDGSPEHPFHAPFVAYSNVVSEFEKAVMVFVSAHPEMELTNYREIMEKNGIRWGLQYMKQADASELDGITVTAMIVGAVRAERFCDGALLSFFKDGSILNWLKRLLAIDSK